MTPPGKARSRETAVGTHVFYCFDGHANELLSRKTAKSLDVELLDRSKPRTRYSMTNGYCKPSAGSTSLRAIEKLSGVFVNLSGPTSTPSLLGRKHVMIV